MTNLKSNDIILPDEIIEQARQLLETGERPQWALGDFLVGVYDELSPIYEAQGVGHVRAGILRDIANKTGADKSTLYDRMSMARLFTPEIRAEFQPPLSYHQLRACKSAGDHWREWAEWAANNLPAPVDLLRARIKANGHDLPAWVPRWERVQYLAEVLRDDPGVPGEIRRVCDRFIQVANLTVRVG